MSVVGGKDRYMNLLALIKRESPVLYEVINDLGLDGTFRSQRYQNTFLMPSKELIKKLEHMVSSDKDEEAIDALRSLILKKHYDLNDFKTKDIVMGTLQVGKVLKSPSDVGNSLKASKKTVYSSKTGAPVFTVYEYGGSSFPETVPGQSGGMVLATKTTRGGSSNAEKAAHNEITNSLVVKGNASATVQNFFKAVSALLAKLESSHEELFDNAKFYLAANPILSWYFLTMPGCEDAIVNKSIYKDISFENGIANMDLIKQCNHRNYTFNRELFKSINNTRSKLISEHGDKAGLMNAIKNAYEAKLEQLHSAKAVDNFLAKHVDVKILMDELRCQYDDAVDSWGDVEDTLNAAMCVDWCNAKASFVLTDDDIHKRQLIKGTEAFVCGPLAFVKSMYFLYIPLTEQIEDQLEERKKGGISGGNPNASTNLIFKGGAAKKHHKASNSALKAFVNVLSKSQREELKQLL